MSAVATPAPQIITHRVAREERGWVSWLTTTDHKRIGILFMVTSFVFFVLGGVEALLMRLQLGAANNTLVTPQTYNQLFTMHGTTMVFLFVVPMMAGFATYLVPLMIGARNLAFPRLAALSYWLFLAGGIVLYASLFFSPPEAGWVSTVPLASSTFLPSGGEDVWIYLILLTSLASLLGAINLYATITNMRADGMSWSRMPLFVWSTLAFALLLIVTLPVLMGAVTLLLADRHFGTHFYDPANGGSPLLWQHLFWFFGHPEVYVMVLPAMGIVSEVLPVFARKPIFGYRFIATATVAIAGFSLFAWVQHMYATPSPVVLMIFAMLAALLIVVPISVMIFNWIGTLWRGAIHFTTALWFAAGFIALFAIGGITGIFLAIFPVDWQLNDTYFEVANLHFMLVGGAVFGIFSGIYYWFPKLTGRMLSETLGRWSCLLMFVGVLVTFLIQHSLGFDGMPRRVYEYDNVGHLQLYNQISTIGSWILGLGVLATIANVVRSHKGGTPAGPDPWQANTLEWFTTSPPPSHNFDVIPRVRSAEPMKDIRREVERQPIANDDNAGVGV